MRTLRVRGQDVALVTPEGQRIAPFGVADLRLEEAVADDVSARAFAGGLVPPGERTSGFLYFPEPSAEDDLQLRIDLIDATSGTGFGVIEIPFRVE
jgi:hypothetical protein